MGAGAPSGQPQEQRTVSSKGLSALDKVASGAEANQVAAEEGSSSAAGEPGGRADLLEVIMPLPTDNPSDNSPSVEDKGPRELKGP